MNTIYCHGTVITLNPSQPRAQAVAVEEGVIRAVGTNDEILALQTPDTRIVDLHGAFLYPGFTDNHMHTLITAQLRDRLDLSPIRSYASLMDLLTAEAQRIRTSGSNEWVLGVKYNQYDWADRKTVPTRQELDAVTGDVPCYLLRACEHVALYNTRALEMLGLMSEKPGTELCMGFLPDGSPDGQLFEGDCGLAEALIPQPGPEEIRRWIAAETKIYASMGLTAIHSDDLVVENMEPLQVMDLFREAADADEIAIRIYEQCRIEDASAIRAFTEAAPRGTSFGLFRTNSIKLILDGSLGAHSAYMLDGYRNDPDAQNIALFTDEQVNAMVQAANAGGYPVVAHAIGDGAVEQILQAYEQHGQPGQRNSINHCQIMRDGQLQRMAAHSILAYTQPVFIGTDAPIIDDCVGETIAASSYNWRRMIDLGIHVSGGSDCPVEVNDPIANIYYAVTRDGGNGTPYRPENGMTMDEALRAVSLEGAYAASREQVNGTVETGKYADFTVLDRDLFAIDPFTIRDSRVMMTVVNDRIVYQREEAWN
ncbi:MAG: amidohydrolase [Oscillospiraceae bacterium]|nr:amidohydrolase [Oscillospiraceae bacterium]